MTSSSMNRTVADISDSASCIGLANWLAIPTSASARQISFRISRVATSIVATYINNRISRIEAMGAIQLMKCTAQKRWEAHEKVGALLQKGGTLDCPPSGVRRPYQTAAAKALVIALIPAV